MAISFAGVRYIVNGEPLDANVLNRPVSDLVGILNTQLPVEFYNKTEINALMQNPYGYLSKAVTGGTVTLTAAEAANPVIRLTGVLTSNLIVDFPVATASTRHLYSVTNATTGAFTVTLRAVGGSNTVAVAASRRVLVSADSSDVFHASTQFDGMVLTGGSTAVTATANNNTTQIATNAFVHTATSGMLSKAVTGGTVALTDIELINSQIVLTGVLTSNLILTVPSTAIAMRLLTIRNTTTGAFTTNIRTASGSILTAIGQGTRKLLVVDTEVRDMFETIEINGASTSVTPSIWDNSLRLATTEFVRRQSGNYRGSTALTTTTALDDSAFGRLTLVNSATPFTVTLPLTSASGGAGGVIHIQNTGTADVTIASSGAEPIRPGNSSANLAPLVVRPGTYVAFAAHGTTWWVQGNGSPVPTPVVTTNDGQIASTAFVHAVAAYKANLTIPNTFLAVQTYDAGFVEKVVNMGAGVQIDFALGTVFKKTITANTNFTVSNVPAVGMAGCVLEITNGNAFVVNWPAGTKWDSGLPPFLTTAGVDIVVLYSNDAGATIRGFLAARDSK